METMKIEIRCQELRSARTMSDAIIQTDMINKAVCWHELGLRYIGG